MITVSSSGVNFSKSSQAWKDRLKLKHWAYTCTFVAFHSLIHGIHYYFFFCFHLCCIFLCWQSEQVQSFKDPNNISYNTKGSKIKNEQKP